VALDLFINTRWKAVNEVERLLWWPVNRIGAAWAGAPWGAGWRLYGRPLWQLHRGSTVTIGTGLSLRSGSRTNPLGVYHPCIICTWTAAAILRIGNDFGLTGGAIVCAEQVTIGDRVWVGANTVITDTDFHPLHPADRRRDPKQGATAPVVIGDEVFIGMNAQILKGVQLGTGCVIGAGSVVTRDVPPGMIAAGNPARVIKPVVSVK